MSSKIKMNDIFSLVILFTEINIVAFGLGPNSNNLRISITNTHTERQYRFLKYISNNLQNRADEFELILASSFFPISTTVVGRLLMRRFSYHVENCSN